jgi:hypothetical protein
MTMNVVTEGHISGRPIGEKATGRPVRMVRWFIIVGLLLALLVGALVGFNAFRSHMIAQFFANNKPPPTTVTVIEAKSELIPNLLTAVGDLAAVHQVNVTTDIAGRITDIMFEAGASVKAGHPLVQLFDGPEQGDLASFKAQATGASLALDRAKQLAARQFGPQSTVAEARARAIRRRTRRASCRSRPVPERGNADRHADRSVDALCQLHCAGEGECSAQGWTNCAGFSRRLSWPDLRWQDHDHRAADPGRYTQHPRSGHDRQS